MKAYELLYFVDSATPDETREAVANRIEAIVKDPEGSIDNIDDWGKRKLAYEINGQAEADYILVDFHTDPQTIAELDRVLRINDAVMRHMIVARTDRD